MRPPYYLVTAICYNAKCSQFEKPFTKSRKTTSGVSTSGQLYTITELACPVCHCRGDISEIRRIEKEKTTHEP